MNSEAGLPSGWSWVKLGTLVENSKKDLVDGPFGSNLKADEYVDKGIPVFKIQNIKANRFVEKNLNYVTEEKAASLARHSFKRGDLIITKLGDPLGLCCRVPDKFEYGIIVADLMRLRPSPNKVFDKYLINVINSEIVQSQFKKITKGTTRPRVNLTIVRDIEIPLPSIEVQKQIVSRIEELFSELDKGIEELRTAQQQLKVYRQAVLSAGTSGILTKSNADYVNIITIGLPIKTNKNWDVVKLTNVARLESGHTPRKDTPAYWENGNVLWLSLQDIRALDGKIANDFFFFVIACNTPFAPSSRSPSRRIAMNTNKKVGFRFVGKRGPKAVTIFFCRTVTGKDVVGPGKEHLDRRHFSRQFFAQLFAEGQCYFSFGGDQPVRPLVGAAMAGIDDDCFYARLLCTDR